MESQHKNILQDMRMNIANDLDVENKVIDVLKTKNVLKSEQVERILRVQSRKGRAELLLNILPRCGRTAFNAFRDSLVCNYWWLSYQMSELSNSRSQDATDFVRSIPEKPPNLPYQPPPVFREKQVGEMKSELENLKPGGCLVLHGMKGFGKSSLTASTLADEELILRLFDNKIYWIKFGNKRGIEDEISIQLNRLYHQVVGNSENVNSSLNFESLKQHLLNCLQAHFRKNHLFNALLILDDVWSNDIIEAFDLPCKTLVITADLHILEDKQHQIIELKDGFTESESLGLFAESLKIDVRKLPSEAKRIHEECYGMPMLISMLAGEFKKFDDLVYNTERWKSYLAAVRTNDTSRMLKKVRAKQEAIFDMCIDKLELDAKSRYEKLVIFNGDVNITPQTLQILWEEKTQCEVDQHMLYFCEKSLAARYHNRQLKSYVYGIHELLLSHLLKKITSEQLKELHKSFVDKYHDYCLGDFSKLPNDNYSFSYIGHHLEQSGMLEEFKKLYLNFDFLTAKINHSGLGDLLIDLKKYKQLITGDDEEVQANLVDVEEFLKREAGTIVNHKRRQCLDLLQIGLTFSKSGFVAQYVREIAVKRSSKLYVTYDKRYRSYQVPESLEVMADTEKIVFLNHPDEILIGNSTGEVMFWNCETREYSLFCDKLRNDTNDAIRKIIVSSNGGFFLTLGDSGQVNLFNVRNEERRLSSSASRNGQTPREKQHFWFPIHGDKVSKDSSQLPISVKDEIITGMALSDDKRIGICTSSGTIEVWSIDGEKIFSKKIIKKRDKMIYENFQWVTFTENSAMLQVMNDNGEIRFYVEKREKLMTSEKYCEIFLYHPDFKEQSFILFQSRPGNNRCLVIVTERRAYYLTWLELPDKKDLHRAEGIITPTLREGAEINSVESYFTCAALTADGKYLVTGHSKRLVTVWNVDETSVPIADFTGHVTSLDTFWLHEGCHLICGSDDRIIHRWSLENLPVRSFLFDAAMKPRGEDDIVAKENFDNIIEIYRGNSMIAKTESIAGTLTDLAINSEGNKVVYLSSVAETASPPRWLWKVMVFDVELKETMAIANLIERPTILQFLTLGDYKSIVYTERKELRIWFGNRCRSSASARHVTNIHVVNESEVLTITPYGVTLFRVTNVNWHLITMVEGPDIAEDKIICSSMAPNVSTLTVLTANGLMIIYDIEEDNSVDPTDIKISCQEPISLPQKIICCQYSPDSKYLALGLDNGCVSVLDAMTRINMCVLDFHCHEVSHLHWWPSSIGAPILLSANRDELAWWNLSPELEGKQKSPRNRKRPYRSTQIATLECQGTCQSSSEMENQITHNEDNNNNNVVCFWKKKTAKYHNINNLLSVVPLPPTHKMKLCISDDCTKLLFIDTHGSICNLKFLNYP